MAATGGGYDLTKAAQMAAGAGVGAAMLRGARQAPVTSHDHPLAMHSKPKSTYSSRSAKGKAKVSAAFHEVEDDEPAVVATTRRKKGAKAARKQKVAIALSKARRAGVRIPKKG